MLKTGVLNHIKITINRILSITRSSLNISTATITIAYINTLN